MSALLANFLKRFFSHYLPVQKGLSENTVFSYRDAIKLLLCYAADRCKKSVDELCVEDIDESLVLTFLDHLETVRGCSPSTRNARLAAPSSTDSLSNDIWDEQCVNQPRTPGRCTLGPDQYFMMGDNRSSSSASRFFGPVPEELVVGRAFLRIWPLGDLSSL